MKRGIQEGQLSIFECTRGRRKLAVLVGTGCSEAVLQPQSIVHPTLVYLHVREEAEGRKVETRNCI